MPDDDVDSDRNFYYSPGEDQIWQDAGGTILTAAQTLNVRWRELGGDVMSVYDSAVIATRAAIEVGTGIHDHMIDDSGQVDAVAELAKAQAILYAKSVIPVEISGVTDESGLRPGQVLTVALTVPSVTAVLLVDTADAVPRDSAALRYTFHASSAAYDDWVAQWERVLSAKAGGSQISASAGAVVSSATDDVLLTLDGVPVTY